MYETFYQKKTAILRKSLCSFVAFAFSVSLIIAPASRADAQYITNLPKPGEMVLLSPTFQPPVLKGMTLHPENPLQFDFIVDRGQDRLSGDALKDETQKLLKYFLAAMTIPDDDAWVNLSPYEGDRIIPDMLGSTDMGKQMLEQDYLLKQLSASLTNPQEEIGKKFWDTVYKKAFEKFGTTAIPINTFNKVWIMPDRAVILEEEGYVFIGETHLKVMLDEDYTSIKENLKNEKLGMNKISKKKVEDASAVSSQVVRQIILPELEKEINEGKNFASVRQIYHSVILAAWYKQNLKNSLLGKVYVDQSKIKGVDIAEKDVKQKVYEQYLAAFRKGVYNLIKEDYDLASKEALPRKYFSGGLVFGKAAGSAIQRLTPNDPRATQLISYIRTDMARNTGGSGVGQYTTAFVQFDEGEAARSVAEGLRVARAQGANIPNAAALTESEANWQVARFIERNEDRFNAEFAAKGIANAASNTTGLLIPAEAVFAAEQLLLELSEQTNLNNWNQNDKLTVFGTKGLEYDGKVYSGGIELQQISENLELGFDLSNLTPEGAGLFIAVVADRIQKPFAGEELALYNEFWSRLNAARASSSAVTQRTFEQGNGSKIVLTLVDAADGEDQYLKVERSTPALEDGKTGLQPLFNSPVDANFALIKVTSEMVDDLLSAKTPETKKSALSEANILPNVVLGNAQALMTNAGLPSYSIAYWQGLWGKWFGINSPKAVPLTERGTPTVIGDVNEGGNYLSLAKVSLQSPDSSRPNQPDLSQVSYRRSEEYKRNSERYEQTARDRVNVLLQIMNAGRGDNFVRIDHLAKLKRLGIIDRDTIAAKSMDTFNEQKSYKGHDENGNEVDISVYVSIFENSYLQVIYDAIELGSFKSSTIQQAVNEDSEAVVNDFLDNTIYFYDRIDRRPGALKRTYRQVFRELAATGKVKLTDENLLLPSMPVINSDTGEVIMDAPRGNSGHGLVAFVNREKAASDELPNDNSVNLIVSINGDGVNNIRLDPSIAGFIAEEKIAVGVLVVTRKKPDIKVGVFGLKWIPWAKKWILAMAEIAQFKNSTHSQLEAFRNAGLVGDEIDRQPINTNTDIVNKNIVKPFLTALKSVLSEEEYIATGAPDLIPTAGKFNGIPTVRLEGAKVSAWLNFDAYLRTTTNQAVQALVKQFGFDKRGFVTLIEIADEDRNDYFSPNKFVGDQFVYKLLGKLQKDWRLDLGKKTLPAIEFQSTDKSRPKSWTEYNDVEEKFGLGTNTNDLVSLYMEGTAYAKDAIYKGHVGIYAPAENTRFDLDAFANDPTKNRRADGSQILPTQNGRIIFDSIAVTIDEKGNVSVMPIEEYHKVIAYSEAIANGTAPAAASSGVRVLVVDSRITNRVPISNSFRTAGYSVTEAENLDNARQIIEDGKKPEGNKVGVVVVGNGFLAEDSDVIDTTDAYKGEGEKFVDSLVTAQDPNNPVIIMMGDADAVARVQALRNNDQRYEEKIAFAGDVREINSNFISNLVDRIPPATSSTAVTADVASAPVGGIDFDPSLLNLQIKRNSKGVPLPLPQQNIENIHIDGLIPVIINMQPATIQNFPFLLSSEKQEKVPELSMR